MRNTILAILLSLVCAVALAQRFSVDNGYNATCLDMQSGLPSNSVTDMLEDSYGFLWIASDIGGLVRYDGYSFVHFGVAGRGVALRSNSCRNLGEDRFRRLWITFREGTDVLDLHTMQSIRPEGGGAALDSLLAQPAKRVVTDSRGCVWLATETTVARIAFDEQGHVESLLTQPYSVRAFDIALADIDGDGNIWAALDGEICKLHPKNNRLTREPVSTQLNGEIRGNYVTAMLRQGSTAWIGTNEGLVSYDLSAAHVERRYRHQADNAASLAHNFVTCLATSDHQQLLVGTLNGVNLLDERGVFNQWNTRNAVNPLSSNFVHCLLPCHGMLWVGTDNAGIVRLAPRQFLLRNYVHTAAAESLSAGCVNAMYVEPDGTLWAGTVEGGLNRKAPGSDSFAHYTTANSGLSHNSVSALTNGADGTLWVGTWGGGVCKADMRHPEQIEPLHMQADYDTRVQFVGALAYDTRNQGLWIASNGGIYFYNLQSQQMEEPYEGCREVRGCIGALIDREECLWIGCLDGVRIIDLKSRKAGKGTFSVTALQHKLDAPESGIVDKLTAFCQSHDGTLWLGSNGYGLYRRTKGDDGQWTYKCYTTEDGLANNAVRGIVEDKNGHLWITTTNGLSELNPKTGIFSNYFEADGFASAQFYWNSAMAGPDGRMYFGSDRALTIFDGLNTADIYEGRLCFTRLFVDNQEITPKDGHIDCDISQARKLRLHESDKSFTIEFSALNYSGETQGLYSYRLRGFDGDWIALEPGQHTVRYTNLPAGSYRLEVKYVSAVADEANTIALDVVVRPYFWKSWWFLALLTCALAALAVWLYKRRIEVMRKREAERLMQPIEKVLRESDNPQQLQMRIQSILANQRRYAESSKKSVEADAEEVKRNTRSFMDRVMGVMEKNYMNSEFGVSEFCEQMGMSRSLLSKKLNEETGQSTTQFIRHYRLDIASQILKRGDQRNIAEIAFSVGFNDPKYFTRCFTKLYGVSPSSFMS